MKFVVQTTRIETIAYEIEADSPQDAEARYLMDGQEVASETVSTTVDSVEQGSASDILG